MLTEGVGKHMPVGVTIRLTHTEIKYFSAAAIKIEEFRGYSQRTDKWGKGYIESPLFSGLCGEQALCKFLNRRLHTNLVPNTKIELLGDGGRDIVIDELVVQVKTIVSGHKCLIRRISAKRRLKPLICHIFVFAKLTLPTVKLLGWITAIRATEVGSSEKSSRDEHWNLCIPKDELESITTLDKAILSRKVS